MSLSSRWFVLSLLLPACIDDEVEFVEQTQELSSVGLYSWGHLDGHADLGSASTKTCFLRGIHGSLDGIDSQGGVGLQAGVILSIQNGRWDLYTFHGEGPGVSGQVTCIPYTANRVFLSTLSGPTSVPVTENRQCFLSYVRAHGNAWTLHHPDGSTPSARVSNVTGNWVLSQHTVDDQPEGPTYGGHVGAVCVDVPITGLASWAYTASSLSFSTEIVPSSRFWWGCGLTALRGVFTDSWSELGVEAHYHQPDASWKLTLAAHKGADVRCIK